MTHDHLNPSASATPVDVTTVEVRAGERIRWGAIVAGLFAALSTLILLTVLGIAIGLSAYDPGDLNRGWSIGAGIWSAISMIVAFIVGGWIAGRWGAPYGFNSPLLHGAMVWAVAIPLSLFVLGSIGSMFGSAAATGAMTQSDRFDGAQPAGATIGDQATGRQATENMTDSAAGAAWGTLISLLLGLGAAAMGGYLGAGGADDRNRYDRRGTTRTTTT